MTLSTKQLKAVILLCRKHGVAKIKTSEVELEFTDNPYSTELLTKKSKEPTKDTPDATVGGYSFDPTWDNMTDEEKLFWSTNSAPETEKTK